MAATAIMLFLMTIVIGLFTLPFVTDFARHPLLNDVLKRSMWSLGLFLLTLISAMTATLAQNAAIPLTHELLRFTAVFSWAAYIFIAYLIISFAFRAVKFMTDTATQNRTGIGGLDEKD